MGCVVPQILKPADKKKFPQGPGTQRPVTPMRGNAPKNTGKM